MDAAARHAASLLTGSRSQEHVHSTLLKPRWMAVSRRFYYAARTTAVDPDGVLWHPCVTSLRAFAPWSLAETWKSSCSGSATFLTRPVSPSVATSTTCRACWCLRGARPTALRRTRPSHWRAVEFCRSVPLPVLILRQCVRRLLRRHRRPHDPWQL